LDGVRNYCGAQGGFTFIEITRAYSRYPIERARQFRLPEGFMPIVVNAILEKYALRF